jgi:hypothetical protein
MRMIIHFYFPKIFSLFTISLSKQYFLAFPEDHNIIIRVNSSLQKVNKFLLSLQQLVYLSVMSMGC